MHALLAVLPRAPSLPRIIPRASPLLLLLHRRTLTTLRPRTTMDGDYEKILKGKYPAKDHARRVVEQIRSKRPDATGVLYLESRKTKLLEDNDEAEPFRQRRFFYYLTGCPLADSYVIHDMDTSKTTLFIPPIDPDSVIWSGLPVSAEEALSTYDVDEVKYTTNINASLAHAGAAKPGATVFAIPHYVSEAVTFLEFDGKDFALLQPAIETARVVKSTYELALIAKANAVSHDAHLAVMSRARAAQNERQLEAAFLASCIADGARNQAYHGIFASGTAAATLHYTRNNEPTAGKLNLLVDAGCEWNCYASDITRTFPLSGTFSAESRAIYDVVLRMQDECIAMLKAGVLWEDVHVRAHEVAIEGLLALGIFRAGSDPAEILKTRTSVAFFPHGLGHYLGMDTHDTGGNPDYGDKDIMFRYLRVRGTLPEGSVVTVEPGVYFCEFIIKPFLEDEKHSRFIDPAVLERYWEVGGVRIEDNVVITKDGIQNLTTVPKDPDEMQRIIRAGQA